VSKATRRALEAEPVALLGFGQEALVAGTSPGEARHLGAHALGVAAVVEPAAVVEADAVERVHRRRSTSSDMRRPHSVHSSSSRKGAVMMVGPASKVKPSWRCT
jgi:hypothetical protein